MSRIGALDGLDRFDWTVVVGAAVVALVPAGLVASSLGIGLAQTVEDELARNDMPARTACRSW
jgi:adenine/guanine phosphoribosyltransferase-like PRPP-binding protein